jgi:hypothetical protein
MNPFIAALFAGFRDLFRKRMIAILFVPAVGAILIWLAIGYWAWQPVSLWAANEGVNVFLLDQIPSSILGFLGLNAQSIAVALSSILVVAILLPLMVLTALGVSSLIATPITVDFVAFHFYPNLIKKSNVTLSQTVWMTGNAIFIYLFLWFVTIPFWFIPGINFFLPILLNTYLNYKMFSFDTLSAFATREETEQILKENKDGYLALALVASLFLFPPLFLIAPVYSALIFSHYGFSKLKLIRERGQSQPI